MYNSNADFSYLFWGMSSLLNNILITVNDLKMGSDHVDIKLSPVGHFCPKF